jgi:hypothetical protein
MLPYITRVANQKSTPPHHTKQTAPCSQHTQCHVFRGTVRCTPCTESNRYLYESRNCIHRSPHKIGHFSSSFLALFSSVSAFSVCSFLPFPHLLLKRSLVTKFAFRLRDRWGAFTFRSVSGKVIISRTERPTDVERPIADTLRAADRPWLLLPDGVSRPLLRLQCNGRSDTEQGVKAISGRRSRLNGLMSVDMNPAAVKSSGGSFHSSFG